MFIAINAEQPCVVRLDDYRVPFASPAEAQAYVSLLRKRIAAPHVLPDLPRSGAQNKFRRSEPPLDRSA